MPFCFLGKLPNIKKEALFSAGGGFGQRKDSRKAKTGNMEQLGIVRQEAATSVFTVCLQELEMPRYFYFLASFIAVISSHLSVFSVCHPEINSDYSTELPTFQKINAMM